MDNQNPKPPRKETPKPEPKNLMTRGEFYMELLGKLESALDIAQANCVREVAVRLKTTISVIKSVYKADDLLVGLIKPEDFK